MTDRETAELLKKAVAALEERANAQPCDDAISRYDALNAVTMAAVRSVAIENIELIPNTYQRKTGKWAVVYIGDELANAYGATIRAINKSNGEKGYICTACNNNEVQNRAFDFCPNCGARMEAEA